MQRFGPDHSLRKARFQLGSWALSTGSDLFFDPRYICTWAIETANHCILVCHTPVVQRGFLIHSPASQHCKHTGTAGLTGYFRSHRDWAHVFFMKLSMFMPCLHPPYDANEEEIFPILNTVFLIYCTSSRDQKPWQTISFRISQILSKGHGFKFSFALLLFFFPPCNLTHLSRFNSKLPLFLSLS